MNSDATERPSVVVPAVAVPSTIAVLRSLGAAGIETVVVSENPTAAAFCSNYCDEAVLVPDPETDLGGYKTALLALARRDDVRTVVPVREEDVFVLSKHREEFADHVGTPWPALDTLKRVHDRVALAATAEAAGVPVPETRRLSDVEMVESRSVVKSRYNLLVADYVDTVPGGESGGSSSIRYLQPGERPDREALRAEFGHDPIVQEFVPISEEYMFGGLYDHGEPVATFQHRQVRGTSYANGGGVYRESVSDPDLEAAARSLLDRLDWHGLACIEYMRDPETGEFKLAEINPRMWQSLSANVRMGADFPWYYWQLATGRADGIDDDYDVGVGSHHLMGELSYLLSLFTDDSPLVERPSFPSSLREVLGDCSRHPTFDLLSPDDPWPFVQDVLAALGDAPLGPGAPKSLRRLGRTERPVHWREVTDEPPDDSESEPRKQVLANGH